jgi:chromosome segregation ATPase
MSLIGKINTESNLPEDIEKRIEEYKESISLLERQKLDLENSVGSKKIQEQELSQRITDAHNELNRIVAEQKTRISSLEEREEKISQKESALDIYANALKSKEEKINKYLAVFDNMKNVISK